MFCSHFKAYLKTLKYSLETSWITSILTLQTWRQLLTGRRNVILSDVTNFVARLRRIQVITSPRSKYMIYIYICKKNHYWAQKRESMSLGRNSAQFGDKPGCTNTIDGKRRSFSSIFVALISCAVTAPVFVWFAKTVFFLMRWVNNQWKCEYSSWTHLDCMAPMRY